MTAPALSSYREERRRDRIADAKAEGTRQQALTGARIAQQQAEAEIRREDRRSRQAQRAEARQVRAKRRAERLVWIRDHQDDLLFVPVVAVPATLAWSAMAAYGYLLFGPVGLGLPALSEGAMWVFEFSATRRAHHDPERPTWHLRIGSWAFCAIGAALNFLHGLTPVTGRSHGVVVGLVMALVSAAGLLAHQIVHMGPRRSRGERAAARRKRAVRRATERRAVAELDAGGNVTMAYKPATVAITRKRGRIVLVDVPPADRRVWLPWPMTLPESTPPPRAKGARKPSSSGQRDSKTARFLALVKDRHGDFCGIDPEKVSKICSDLAPEVGLNVGSARSALRPLVLSAQDGAR